jgi:phosphate transport system substrate-binding protein
VSWFPSLMRPAKRAGAAALTLGLLALTAAATRADDVTLIETGSSLIYPLFKVWAAEYEKTHPGVHIATSSTGSTEGVKQAILGVAHIGTSDAYMTDAEARQHPQRINVAMAISAMTVNYNLPGLNTTVLKLDGPVLADIYAGRIRAWDDKAIAFINPDINLPHHDIIAVHRADGSGDTFVFTQYLTFSTSPRRWERDVGFGNSVKWPDVSGALSATGNTGVLQTMQQNPYSIGYLGISYHTEVAKAELGTALLKSYSGEFLLPTPETITAAAAALTPRTPADERLSLVNAPGAHAFPLINHEYAIVSTKQANPATASALRKFLLWAIAPDETKAKFLEDAHFIPLPARIWVLSHDQIEAIK